MSEFETNVTPYDNSWVEGLRADLAFLCGYIEGLDLSDEHQARYALRQLRDGLDNFKRLNRQLNEDRDRKEKTR